MPQTIDRVKHPFELERSAGKKGFISAGFFSNADTAILSAALRDPKQKKDWRLLGLTLDKDQLARLVTENKLHEGEPSCQKD